MNNQKILEKAIQKAIDGGFKYKQEFVEHGYQIADGFQISEDGTLIAWMYHGERMPCEVYAVIFNHDFARALWGEKRYEAPRVVGEGTLYNGRGELTVAIWQYHLQQMVIADDLIEYLGSSI